MHLNDIIYSQQRLVVNTISQGVLKMPPRQRFLAIKLAEKIKKKPHYAEKLGIVIENKKKDK